MMIQTDSQGCMDTQMSQDALQLNLSNYGKSFDVVHQPFTGEDDSVKQSSIIANPSDSVPNIYENDSDDCQAVSWDHDYMLPDAPIKKKGRPKKIKPGTRSTASANALPNVPVKITIGPISP